MIHDIINSLYRIQRKNQWILTSKFNQRYINLPVATLIELSHSGYREHANNGVLANTFSLNC